jgi:hypothetical protein
MSAAEHFRHTAFGVVRQTRRSVCQTDQVLLIPFPIDCLWWRGAGTRAEGVCSPRADYPQRGGISDGNHKVELIGADPLSPGRRR